MNLIDWPTLRAWCLAHDAKNDRIVSIRIDGRGDDFNVVMEGHELNDDGLVFIEGLSHVPATWRSVSPLKSLP